MSYLISALVGLVLGGGVGGWLWLRERRGRRSAEASSRAAWAANQSARGVVEEVDRLRRDHERELVRIRDEHVQELARLEGAEREVIEAARKGGAAAINKAFGLEDK